ncbi:MAG: hypothetical protein K2Q25_10020 [Mycobacteriaceae bacterium]|nr:hypothetical protein [Mycobacteriaceae bacterium]
MPLSVAAALLMLGLITLTGHFIGFTDSSDDEFGESVPAFGKDQGATVVGGLADVAWIATISDILRKTGFIPTAVLAEPAGVEALVTGAADSGVVVEATATETTMAEAKFAEATAGVEEFLSPFLNVYVLAEALEATLGFGEPYRGGDIEVGSKHFSALGEQLNLALPDDGWQGLAMSAYSEKIVALQDISLKLAELDTQLAYHAKDHAKRVNDIRLGVGFLKSFAIVGHFVCPDDGEVIALAFGAYITMMAFIFKFSTKHGSRVSNLCDEYQRLGAQVAPLGPVACAAGVKRAAARDATVPVPLPAGMPVPQQRPARSRVTVGVPGLPPAGAEVRPVEGDFAWVARIADGADGESMGAGAAAIGAIVAGRAQSRI